MIQRRRFLLILCALALAAGTPDGMTGAWAQTTTHPTDRLVYVPPDLGAPPTRTLAAARGPGEAPAVQVLAPPQTGLTAVSSPRLIWYLTRPSAARIEIALIDDLTTVLDLDLGPIEVPGPRVIDLEAHGVQLAPGRDYVWSVAQVIDPDQRSADVVASATIRMAPPDAATLARLTAAQGVARLELLARQGYWYDLVAEMTEALVSRPDDEVLRMRWADLLDQVGLAEVAAIDETVR